jgi:hypothetical protein
MTTLEIILIAVLTGVCCFVMGFMVGADERNHDD